MKLAAKFAAVGIVALLILQLAWHGLALPPEHASPWLVALMFSLPLLPALLLLIGKKPSASFWGGVASLFYFCHGIAESWAVVQARPFALLEVALALWIIVAGSWDGMKARFSKRKRPSANV
jgi:uncharacterized membrane protein